MVQKTVIPILLLMIITASLSAQQTSEIRRRHPITSINIALAAGVTSLALVSAPPVYGAQESAVVQQRHGNGAEKADVFIGAQTQTDETSDAYKEAVFRNRRFQADRSLNLACNLFGFALAGACCASLFCPQTR